MATATRPRVLLLDWLGHYSEAWLQDARELVDLVTLGGRGVGTRSFWYTIPGTGVVGAGLTAEIVAQETWDLIFLGNNMEAGVDIAKLLSPEARMKTIVVSHIGVAGNAQREYEKLGITRPEQFVRRREILSKLQELVTK